MAVLDPVPCASWAERYQVRVPMLPASTIPVHTAAIQRALAPVLWLSPIRVTSDLFKPLSVLGGQARPARSLEVIRECRVAGPMAGGFLQGAQEPPQGLLGLAPAPK